jgi:hypothetical protein
LLATEHWIRNAINYRPVTHSRLIHHIAAPQLAGFHQQKPYSAVVCIPDEVQSEIIRARVVSYQAKKIIKITISMACNIDHATGAGLNVLFSDLIFISLCYKLASIYLLDYE